MLQSSGDSTVRQDNITTQTNTKPKDNYNIGSAQGELDYYTKNDNLNENLVKKIVSKHLHSVL